MTDQSPNHQFHASSLMQGQNAAYFRRMYSRDVGGNGGTVDKFEAMRSADVIVSESPAQLGETLLEAIG